jgi:molybdopterin-guanine dinucleotide biosynthesis protein A
VQHLFIYSLVVHAMRSGLIVAGGHSTRFGDTDKVVASVAGTPMIRRVADRLAPVVDTLVINCREEQVASIREALIGYSPRVRFACDETPDQGPMAGMATGLRHVEHEYAFVVAADMPLIDPEIVGYLFERAVGSNHDAAIPQLDDQWFQTTHAVYRANAMATACEAALAAGQRKTTAPLSDIDYVVVDESEVRTHGTLDTFENINTPEDRETVVEKLD